MSIRSDECQYILHKLRIKYKSLAAESKAIRLECKRKVSRTRRLSEYMRNSLYLHRVNTVRDELRLTQLALAAVRGVPYDAVERHCLPGNHPDLPLVRSMIERMCPPYMKNQVQGEVSSWFLRAHNTVEKRMEQQPIESPPLKEKTQVS